MQLTIDKYIVVAERKENCEVCETIETVQHAESSKFDTDRNCDTNTPTSRRLPSVTIPSPNFQLE